MLRECSTHGYFRGDKCPDCGDRGKFLMNDEELNRLGRIIAGILRHFPERFGLDMDDNGYVDVIQLINMVRRKRHQFHWLRQNHIQAIVDTDPKQRYEINTGRIRATYGHSLDVDLDLPIATGVDFLYYPTTDEEVDILLETGIKPADRRMVHLSKTAEDAWIAGSHRVSNPVILKINANDAIKNGVRIKKAGSTVFTTREVPAQYLAIISDEELENLDLPEEDESANED